VFARACRFIQQTTRDPPVGDRIIPRHAVLESGRSGGLAFMRFVFLTKAWGHLQDVNSANAILDL